MLDVRQAAKLVGRTPETVRRWVWSGKVSARRQGNRLLIPRRELEQSPHPERTTLADWERRLPNVSARNGASAASLVLDGRTSRDLDAGR